MVEVRKKLNFFSDKILENIIKVLFIGLIFFFPYSIALRETLIGLLFIFYVLNRLIKWKFSLQKTPIDTELLIYFLFSVLSLLKVNDVLVGIEEVIVSVFKYIAFFYMSYDLINESNLDKYINILFYGSFSCIVIGKAIYYITGTNYLEGNGDGTWATFSILFLMSFMLDKTENIYKKIIAFIGGLGGIIVLFNTNSRGAALAFFCAIIIIAIVLLKSKINSRRVFFMLTSVIIIIMIIITPFILLDLLINKFKNITDIDSHWSLKTRVLMWESSIYHIMKNPILGVGIGNYQSNYLNYIDNVLNIEIPHASRMHGHPHNLFLNIAVEQGLISLALFLIMIYKSFKIGLLNFISSVVSNKKSYLGIVLCGILVSLVIHSFVDTTFRYGHVGYFVMIMIVFNCKLMDSTKRSD